ncbi:MAG: hypothetical protein Q8N83_15045 [Ignavibacteria bacterium]|nr:hypothetical protein [Ignavibacteria bacterium]
MNTVFNVVSNKEWVARVYFELDPTGKLFYSTILFLNEGSKSIINKDIDTLQKEVKHELTNKYGNGNYSIIESKPAEREEYEKLFYSKFFSNNKNGI